jgi:hypothetical protein
MRLGGFPLRRPGRGAEIGQSRPAVASEVPRACPVRSSTTATALARRKRRLTLRHFFRKARYPRSRPSLAGQGQRT